MGDKAPRPLIEVGEDVGVRPTVAVVTVTEHRRRATRAARVRTPLPLAAVLALLIVAVGLLAAPGPSGAVDVVGDDEHDVYVGTGGLVVPSRTWLGDEGGRQEAASCEGCSWRITSYCPQLDFDTGGCLGAHVGCPAGLVRVRVWLQQPGEPWRLVGAACQGGDPPVTRAQVGSEVRDRAEAALPALRAAVQPRGSALVGLPAVFRTGQSAEGLRDADLTVLGLPVSLDATPRWRWAWGDGTATWTSAPGGRWPDDSVRHTYRRPGLVAPAVTAVWDAQYVVDGLGPFPVPGPPLTQDDAVPLVVLEARALLVR